MAAPGYLSALLGSFQLAQFDAKALDRFDLTDRGFWASFSAVLAVLPVFAFVIYLQNIYNVRMGVPNERLDVSLLIYLLDWGAVTIGIWSLAWVAGKTERFKACINVYNWCRPLAFAFFIPAFALGALGWGDGEAIFTIHYICLTLRSIFLGYVINLTLQAGYLVVFAAVIMEIVMGLIIAIALNPYLPGAV